ncbi:MAG: alpha-glucuronidase family glycosyl hydrolase [Planctomycetota bacterium]
MNARCFSTALVLFVLSFASNPFTRGAEQVTVVVGQGATDLEHLAAQELVAQFKKLFDANVTLTDFLPDQHQHLVLVGGPAKNKATREVAGESWPKLTDQGFILRSFDAGARRGVIVAGDSPVATYWAVCELGHRFGIRYLLREDIYPDQQPLKLTGLDVLMEPRIEVRAWDVTRDGVMSAESWSVADYQKLLGQLAKMKFNQIELSVRPWQPVVDYEFRAIHKQTAVLWRGEQFPIPRDAPGRTAFGEAAAFENPDFAGKQAGGEMTAAGIKHMRGIIAAAKRLGISVSLQMNPLQFPPEFGRVIPELVPAEEAAAFAVQPGPEVEPDHAAVKELISTTMRAYAETYPNIDKLSCPVSRSKSWYEAVRAIERSLRDQRVTNAVTFEVRSAERLAERVSVLPQSKTQHWDRSFSQRKPMSGPGMLNMIFVPMSPLAELDPTIQYVSRTAWDKSVTARSAHDELFISIAGEQAIADRLWLAFGHIESATELMSAKDADFAVPSPNMLLQHFQGEPAPEWWAELNEHYTQAMIELYRSHGAADARARPLLFYYAKRSEYVLEYLGCVKAVRSAAIAKKEGDIEKAIEQLAAAIESLYNAIDTLGDVAQDPSDRGLIAALNAYAYQPLLAEYERLQASE